MPSQEAETTLPKLPDVYGLKTLQDVTVPDEGKVQSVVAEFDVIDNDAEVIVSGAIADGTKVTVSAYNHDTVMGHIMGTGVPDAAPVGKGIIRVEGKRAIAYLDYFMETQRGREAFLTVKAMGADQAWSFAYRKEAVANPDKEWQAKGARLMLTKLGPLLDGAMEVSPVKQPGGKSTGTISAKQASCDDDKTTEESSIPAPADLSLETRVARVKRQISKGVANA